MMKVKEVAALTGISVRTLHYYDKIGLLIPETITDAGYRLYSDQNLETLQHILFFKELDFPLKTIKDMINQPSFDHQEALYSHRKRLLKKHEQIERMINTIDQTIKHEKGEIHMSNKEKFAGFDLSKDPYEQGARERWGNQAVDTVHKNFKKIAQTNQQDAQEMMNQIYWKLAALRDTSPASSEAQAAIEEWYNFLNQYTGHHYSLEAFKGLGDMYVGDQRFTQNIDQFGTGLAAFMHDAMIIYATNHQK